MLDTQELTWLIRVWCVCSPILISYWQWHIGCGTALGNVVTIICLTFFVLCSFRVYVQHDLIRRHIDIIIYAKNREDCVYPDCQCFNNSYKVYYSLRLKGFLTLSHWFLIKGVVWHTQNLWKRNTKKIPL